MKIVFSILLLALLVFSFAFELDADAMALHNEAFERSMVAFGLAKGLNAVISLIQGTELSFAPMGIGLSISVGEVLDPFNDMVERFSWVMLFASVSLGIQKLLLLLSAKLFLQVVLAFSIVFSLFALWYKKLHQAKLLSFSMKILLFVLVLRFGAVSFVYTNELLYNSLLHTEYVASTKILKKTEDKLQEIKHENTQITNSKKDTPWYDVDVVGKYKTVKSQLDISKRLGDLSSNIERASRKMISLITIFVVQSLLMPLLFLWFLLSMIKWIFRVESIGEKLGIILKT